MAKESKKAPAKPTAKKSATKKPAAKKSTKPKAKAAKAAAPKTVKPAAKKAGVTKTTAKKPTAGKAAAKKPVKNAAARKAATVPVAALLLADATPTIISPAAGPVTASTNLRVRVTTNRTDFAYIITATNASNVVVATINVPAPGASPFQAIIPGTALPAGGTYTINVEVDPASGLTPPNQTDSVVVTT